MVQHCVIKCVFCYFKRSFFRDDFDGFNHSFGYFVLESAVLPFADLSHYDDVKLSVSCRDPRKSEAMGEEDVEVQLFGELHVVNALSVSLVRYWSLYYGLILMQSLDAGWIIKRKPIKNVPGHWHF